MTAARASAAEWPNWRGPNHDGLSQEKGFKTTWSQPPRVVWENPLGAGFSAFAIAGDKAYTCGTKDKQQTVVCLSAETGKTVWERPYEPEYRERQGGDGSRATPTVNDGRVYVFGALGLMLCLDAKDGKEIWRREFKNRPPWGYSASVLIEGDMAVLTPGTADGALLALDRKTGKEIWRCAKDAAGYATPYPFTFDGKRYIAGFMAGHLIVAEAGTGREVLRIPWKTAYAVSAAEPIFHDGYLFITSGYNTGAALFKLSAGADGLAAREVWRNKVLRCKFQSCVLKDGMLYTGDEQALKCVEFATGKLCWTVRDLPNATVLWADRYLIVLSEDGKLMIAPATSKEFKPVAEAQELKGRCWTIPTLCNGRLYLRDMEKAICLDLGS
jgi:outer membrane protein assembly factor BamB